jgi:DNA-binding response OmpR family regulator
MHILLIEDNKSLVANLFDYFEARGHTVDAAPDGLTGAYLAGSHAFDAIVLDWMLPRMDGPAVLQRLRQEYQSDVPVIMLTARDELQDKIAGFRAGADDYLSKPFAMQELEVRLESLVARVQRQRQGRRRVLEVLDLKLDLATRQATRAGRPLHLFPAGWKLLEILMQESPAAVSRRKLEQAIWGDAPPDGDMLRSHIYELRRAVDAPFEVKLIHTVPRLGYRLAAQDHDDANAS